MPQGTSVWFMGLQLPAHNCKTSYTISMGPYVYESRRIGQVISDLIR